MMTRLLTACVLWIMASVASHAADITIGSKKFTESVILGEILAQTAQAACHNATHRAELGGTRIVFEALRAGDIDLYVDSTGTLEQELLGTHDIAPALAAQGLGVSQPLGFNNTYALGMRRDKAEGLGVTTISDLQAHPALRFGFAFGCGLFSASTAFSQCSSSWPSGWPSSSHR